MRNKVRKNTASQGKAAPDARAVVEQCLRTMLSSEASLPPGDADWIATGLLDSMAHSEVLICIEKSAGIPELFEGLPGGPPRTTNSVAKVLEAAVLERESHGPRKGGPEH
jgi:hypothetical protein